MKTPTAASVLPSTQPQTATPAQTETYTSTDDEAWEYRKVGKEAFEKTHKRVTWWLPKSLEKRFNALVRKSNQRKVALVKEAITDLLEKYEGGKPKEPTPWPQYLAEKEQEILALRKLVREAAAMLEHLTLYGEDARVRSEEIEEWMERKREVLEGKKDEVEKETRGGQA